LLLSLLEIAGQRRDPDKVDPKRLGRWLTKYKGRVSSGLKIVRGEDEHKKIALWRVVSASSTSHSAGIAGIAGIVPPISGGSGISTNGLQMYPTGEMPDREYRVKSEPANPAIPQTDIAAIRRAQDIADEWCPE